MLAVRWIVKPKPLVDNIMWASCCYSSLNCINVPRRSGENCLSLHLVCMLYCGFCDCLGSSITGLLEAIVFVFCGEPKCRQNGEALSGGSLRLPCYQKHPVYICAPLLIHNTGLRGRYYIAPTAHTMASCYRERTDINAYYILMHDIRNARH